MLDNLRNNPPLVHNITNYVTVNDCANILLASGASPIMADDQDEVEEITSICSGLNINIGTLNKRTIESMFLAGLKSNELNHPTLLDPVGTGASKLRTDTSNKLLKDISFSVIRGNISEIKSLALGSLITKGVDADITDYVTDKNLNKTIFFAKEFSKNTDSIIVITGAIDIITDGHKAIVIRNGHPMMSKVTGTGCMLSALTTAFICANPNQLLEASAASVVLMGLAGEIAYEQVLKNNSGNSSYRNYIIDAIYNMTSEQLDKGAVYEIY
jgi:hydroxyethylthiazole kinase